MNSITPIFFLLIVSFACDGNPDASAWSGGDGGLPRGIDQTFAPAKSGTRLKTTWTIGSDGSARFERFFDSSLQKACRFVDTSNGRFCLPYDTMYLLGSGYGQPDYVETWDEQFFLEDSCSTSEWPKVFEIDDFSWTPCSQDSVAVYQSSRYDTFSAELCLQGENISESYLLVSVKDFDPTGKKVYDRSFRGPCEESDESFVIDSEESGKRFIQIDRIEDPSRIPFVRGELVTQ